MANYVKSTNFYTKDALLTGNPDKIIKGAEIDTEYNAIAIAVNSKADTTSPALIGTPTAPTATAGNNTTQVATTAFVAAGIAALGTMSTQNKTAVDITGGTITGTTITTSSVNNVTVGSNASGSKVVTTVNPIISTIVTASQATNQLTVSAILTNSLVYEKALVVGAGIPNNTFITVGTSTGSTGTYTLSFSCGTSTASSITDTTLTVGGTVAGTYVVGQTIAGTGVTAGTKITALGTGTGGAGTYTVSVSQTVASTAINASLSSGTLYLTTSGSATFAGSIATTNMTVTSVSSGSIVAGQFVLGASAGTYIVSQTSGNKGGTGVYVVNNSQTAASVTGCSPVSTSTVNGDILYLI
jgi:hypothetical protein